MGSDESQSNVSFNIRKGHSHETVSIRYNFDQKAITYDQKAMSFDQKAITFDQKAGTAEAGNRP